MKTLVVYFSRKGYVKKVAEAAAKEQNADILELKTKERTQGYLGFWWCGRFGMHRWGMELEPLDADVSAYDKVVICSPVWVFTVSAPVRQFVEMAAGQITAADYILVHFSNPMKYPGTVKWLDAALGVTHGSFTSVCCMWGREIRQRVFG